MRKSLILAALIAATAAPPVFAQAVDGRAMRGESRQDIGGPVYERSGGRDGSQGGRAGGQEGGGWRGNRGAPAAAPQQAPQAQPQVQAQVAPVPAPVQQRSSQGGGYRNQQNNAQGSVTTSAPGADRPQWRGNNQSQANQGQVYQGQVNQGQSNQGRGYQGRGYQGQGGVVTQAPVVNDRQRTDGGWSRNGQGNWANNRQYQGQPRDSQPHDNAWNGNRDGRNYGQQGDRYRNDQVRNRSDYGQQNWNRDWRRDQRYNWQSYRTSNRNLYRAPRYYAPYGYGNDYQRFSIGIYLGNPYFSDQYWINDPYDYRLPPAYGPYRWVRYYDDVLLVDVRSGYVVDVIHDFFW